MGAIVAKSEVRATTTNSNVRSMDNNNNNQSSEESPAEGTNSCSAQVCWRKKFFATPEGGRSSGSSDAKPAASHSPTVNDDGSFCDTRNDSFPTMQVGEDDDSSLLSTNIMRNYMRSLPVSFDQPCHCCPTRELYCASFPLNCMNTKSLTRTCAGLH